MSTPSAPQVTDLYLRAAELSPNNADIHAVLGVLYNLSREVCQPAVSSMVSKTITGS